MIEVVAQRDDGAFLLVDDSSGNDNAVLITPDGELFLNTVGAAVARGQWGKPSTDPTAAHVAEAQKMLASSPPVAGDGPVS